MIAIIVVIVVVCVFGSKYPCQSFARSSDDYSCFLYPLVSCKETIVGSSQKAPQLGAKSCYCFDTTKNDLPQRCAEPKEIQQRLNEDKRISTGRRCRRRKGSVEDEEVRDVRSTQACEVGKENKFLNTLGRKYRCNNLMSCWFLGIGVRMWVAEFALRHPS